MAPSWPTDESIFGQGGQNHLEMFMWLPKEQLCVLVYLVSVSHSMMTGYMDKAQKYTENALDQIEKLRAQENKPILSVFQVILLEHIVMCRLIMGNKTAAIKVIPYFILSIRFINSTPKSRICILLGNRTSKGSLSFIAR